MSAGKVAWIPLDNQRFHRTKCGCIENNGENKTNWHRRSKTGVLEMRGVKEEMSGCKKSVEKITFINIWEQIFLNNVKKGFSWGIKLATSRR